ncbi:gamma-mobile-trio recombinase GmtY [Pseudomonas sp. MF7453]|uniref:gamma-mobile-trio recombinase GmtY n=1 Tax=Pseudomonas sp. MF7453 TaxID=2797539 RepID=UPI0018E7B545|nr:gamma-mobile-trio recombinase GmtY [Pseudomonas sp. MF7453]MBJ2220962.1 site-specific integrase [Pseudomonas sp. MF7453]
MIYTETVLVQDKIRAFASTVLLIVGVSPLEQLLEFFREKLVSLSMERTYAQATGRFIEWLSVRAHEFTDTPKRSLLYTAFLHDLRFGTYQAGVDAYGLNWTATSQQNAKRLTRALLEFSDWLNQRHGATMLNPIHHQASPADQLIFWRKWNKQKAASLLAHTKRRTRAEESSHRGRQARLPRDRNGFLAEAKAFPAERLDDLIWQGFINPGRKADTRPWVKYNLRDILITLLCTYGGCRPSEPLHLWVDDVYTDPDDSSIALVLVHEPTDGLVDYIDPITGSKRKTNRADFLQRFCGGRKPLTQETGRRHSGWKGCLLTHRERKAYQVFWIDKNAGRLFLTLWRMYIQYVRPVTPQVPWAFLTQDGQPLGVEGFDDSFRAAVRRIGLLPAKWAGATSHGLRHRYGQWLNDLGLGDKEGQVAMHHLNAKSQDVYRQVGLAKVVAAIGKLTVTALPSFKDTE